jgi:hypothetical protein
MIRLFLRSLAICMLALLCIVSSLSLADISPTDKQGIVESLLVAASETPDITDANCTSLALVKEISEVPGQDMAALGQKSDMIDSGSATSDNRSGIFSNIADALAQLRKSSPVYATVEEYACKPITWIIFISGYQKILKVFYPPQITVDGLNLQLAALRVSLDNQLAKSRTNVGDVEKELKSLRAAMDSNGMPQLQQTVDDLSRKLYALSQQTSEAQKLAEAGTGEDAGVVQFALRNDFTAIDQKLAEQDRYISVMVNGIDEDVRERIVGVNTELQKIKDDLAKYAQSRNEGLEMLKRFARAPNKSASRKSKQENINVNTLMDLLLEMNQRIAELKMRSEGSGTGVKDDLSLQETSKKYQIIQTTPEELPNILAALNALNR